MGLLLNTIAEKPSILLIIFSIILFSILIFLAILYISNKKSLLSKFNKKHLILGLLTILAIKIIVAILGPNFIVDIDSFAIWSNQLNIYGFGDFYESTPWCNYPCGYLYVLYIIGKLNTILNTDFNSPVFWIMLKIPVLIAEFITAFIAYRLSEKHIDKKWAVIIACLILFNPSSTVNTSAWGQIDAFFSLFVIITFLFLQRKNYYLASIFYALTFTIKMQAIFFLPVFGIAYILAFHNKENKIKNTLSTLGISLIIFISTYLIITLPFSDGNIFKWIYNNFTQSVNTYDYVSFCAHNLYVVLGREFSLFDDIFFIFSFKTIGYSFIVLSSLITIVLYNKKKDASNLFLLAAFLMASIFTFAHGMHERYIATVPVLLIFSYIYSHNHRILLSSLFYGIYAAINQLVVLLFAGTGVYQKCSYLSAIFGLASFVYLFYTVINESYKPNIEATL